VGREARGGCAVYWEGRGTGWAMDGDGTWYVKRVTMGVFSIYHYIFIRVSPSFSVQALHIAHSSLMVWFVRI
jgi:hypothetical protein